MEGRADSYELIDVKAKKKNPRNGGRPKNKVLDKLLQECYRRSAPEKVVYRCAAEGCGEVFSNRNLSRTLRHSTKCLELPTDLRKMAAAHLVKRAPSKKVLDNPSSVSGRAASIEMNPKRQKCENKMASSPADLDASKALEKTSLLKGRRARHAKLDLEIVKMFCVAGLPTHLASRVEWKNVFYAADPSYTPASRDKLEYDQIVAEAEHVCEEQLMYLKTRDNLTISYDGGTSRGKEAYWTLHISTPEREVYLVEGREATSDSHTGVWIKNFAMQTINEIGPSRFCAVVCDSTGNTRLSRNLIVREVPTMFELADICHHISCVIKDIVKLTHFKLPIGVVRSTITTFNKSHLGHTELKEARKALGVGRGLEAIGKTRFGTIILSSASVQRCAPAIKKVVEQGRLMLKLEMASRFQRHPSRPTMEFDFALAQLVDLGLPAVKSLACLEANEANAADVYIFWHAMVHAMREVLTDSNHDFPIAIQEQVIGILNYRHRQVFDDGNLANGIYLAATYLDSTYLRSDLFKEPRNHGIAEPFQNDAFAGIRHPSTFRIVATFLVGVAEQEINHGHKPPLTRWKGRAAEFKTQFLKEFKAYARHQFPYNLPVNEKDGACIWWNAIIGSNNAQILPHIAIKIYSVRVNSMPDERTVSTFTWLTPAIRAQLTVQSMVAMTQIHQYHKTQIKVRTQCY
ncbi:ribonuclease H-like domain-containing protein [Infundibulicybe gibba]|nr:ribonuclease H-like domain-containing protein [Infundibulicybe gibba]